MARSRSKRPISRQKTAPLRWLDEIFVRSWWVILFAIVCYMAYEQGMARRQKDVTALQQKLSDLEMQKKMALSHKEDLLLQIHSQSDPEWIELTLMKGLGLVPEGQIKVLLSSEDS